MKLSELILEQKSRWIAEKLGWRNFGEYKFNNLKGSTDLWIPPGGMMNPVYATKLPDFVNDPAMTVMLLEKLTRVAGPTVRLFRTEDNWYFKTEGGSDRYIRTSSLGGVIADAFMLANGWTDIAAELDDRMNYSQGSGEKE